MRAKSLIKYYGAARESHLSHLMRSIRSYEIEARVRHRATWWVPRKYVLVPQIVQSIRRFEKIFTGQRFPIGGPKK